MSAPSPHDWAQIRYDYENTDRPIAHICAEHGISSGTLRDRMRHWKWRRRRPPIPQDGPPAFLTIEQTPVREDRLMPVPVSGLPAVVPDSQLDMAPTPPDMPAPAESGPAVVPQLQGAVTSVLPAIEAAIARFADRSECPRDIEQTARALNAMTRTLRELNALLGKRRW